MFGRMKTEEPSRAPFPPVSKTIVQWKRHWWKQYDPSAALIQRSDASPLQGPGSPFQSTIEKINMKM